MPVATCSVSVASRMGSTKARSAAGDPPTHTAPYPSLSISLACSAVTGPAVQTPKRPRLGLRSVASVMGQTVPSDGVGLALVTSALAVQPTRRARAPACLYPSAPEPEHGR